MPLGAEGVRRLGCPGFLVNQSNNKRGRRPSGPIDPARSSIFSSTQAGEAKRPRRSASYAAGS